MSLIGTSVLVNWGGVLKEKEIDYNQKKFLITRAILTR